MASKGKKGDQEPYKPLPLPPIESLYSSNTVDGSQGKFYITTAINYTNGPPHIGHAYEAIVSDVVARYHRANGRKVFFLTGTDEHGQKIAASAKRENLEPKQLCDRYVTKFQELNKRLAISNDGYVRTTDPEHEEQCRVLWQHCADKGDIYLGKYTGWYDQREESFVPEKEAKKNNFKDKYGEQYQQVSEDCYFFKLEKYRERLLKHINDNPEFITPENRKAEVLAMLKEELPDLCISRTTFTWGVNLPEGFDKKHVMYVWFDALTNYVSATNLLRKDVSTEQAELSSFWPADVHIVGKDIIKFHCIYWPAMLWSAGLPLPKSVAGHGFVLDGEGQKMSKSLGNIVDPHDLLDKYPVDSIRYFICNEAPYGGDLKASEVSLVESHNRNLADTVGNLAQRAATLPHKYYGGVLPGRPEDVTLPLPFDLEQTRNTVAELFSTFQLRNAVMEILKACSEANNWMAKVEPWKMNGADQVDERKLAVRLCVEAVYALAHFLAPFLPATATFIFNKLGHPPSTISQLSPAFDNLPSDLKIAEGEWCPGLPVLFPPIPIPGATKEAIPSPKEPKASKKKDDSLKGGKKAPTSPEALPDFDEDGWRGCARQDFLGRWYLVEADKVKHPQVSGVLTFTAEGSFDQTIYGAEGEQSAHGSAYSDRGCLPILASRTGGLKWNKNTGQLTLKPHHCTDPSELAEGAVFDAKVSKQGVLCLKGPRGQSCWVKQRTL